MTICEQKVTSLSIFSHVVLYFYVLKNGKIKKKHQLTITLSHHRFVILIIMIRKIMLYSSFQYLSDIVYNKKKFENIKMVQLNREM